jgi:hypothetical protein
MGSGGEMTKKNTSNPFAPNYVDPWYLRVSSWIPDWVGYLGITLLMIVVMMGLATILSGVFCCGVCR